MPLNKEKEIKNYCQKLKKELNEIADIRIKVLEEKSLNYRIRQVYQKKIPYYLIVGEKEIKSKMLKLINTYKESREEELTEKELIEKLVKENTSKN